MSKNSAEIGGITFTGAITVNGPMFDIHDNKNVYINNEKKEEGRGGKEDPYEALLMEMIEPLNGHGTWKEILMPYHAAVIENVLPLWSHKIFVEKTGLSVSQSTYSECMHENRYSDDELEPYANRFAQLKMNIENSK